MADILDRLSDNLTARLTKVSNSSTARLLRDIEDIPALIEMASQHVTFGIMSKRTFVNVTERIGGNALKLLGSPFEIKSAIQLGSFVLESFVHCGLVNKDLRMDDGDAHPTYYILPDDRGQLSVLLELVRPEANEHFPFTEKLDDWSTGIHSNGLPLVRNAPPALLQSISSDTHKVVLDAVNKLQGSAWRVNPEVAEVFAYCLDAKRGYGKVLPHQDGTRARSVRASYRVEAEMIAKAADWLGDTPFYHQYNLDFRGRIYPNTAFFNEQSSDRSKGMLLFDEAKPLGEDGWKWLCVHAANSWGNDKVSIADRQLFAEFQMENWMAYAADPIGNPGWMAAEKAWSFLAACFEFLAIAEHRAEGKSLESYLSALPVFIDGSNNGVQHMAALSKDVETAAHVNVTPQDLPGDVYMHICNKVYAQILADRDLELEDDFWTFYKKSMELDKRIEEARNDERSRLIKLSNRYRRFCKAKRFAPNYFMNITDAKQRRKLVKRPVMTLGYGGTRNGFKTMVLEDTKQLSEYFRGMNHSWAQYFGDLIYFTSRGGKGITAQLPGLASMLDLFETLASRAMDDGTKLQWNVPLTNFPVVQQYRKPQVVSVRANFMGTRLDLRAQCFLETTVNKRKQKTSASPNIVHSFDAAHLQLTVNACDFRVATVHDSFGCLPGDMGRMFEVVREQFVRFYTTDPLINLLVQRQSEDLIPVRGRLDVKDVLKSDFAFV